MVARHFARLKLTYKYLILTLRTFAMDCAAGLAHFAILPKITGQHHCPTFIPADAVLHLFQNHRQK
jgi:hypothetical protein